MSLAALLAAILLGAVAPAAAESIGGGELVVTTRVPESGSRVVFESRDPNIQVGVPRGPDDPTCRGDPPRTGKASFEIFSLTAGQLAVYALPCHNWHTVGNPDAPAGYRYWDPERVDGPCTVVQVRRGRLLRAFCSATEKRPLNYPLARTRTQVPLGVHFTSGALRLCAEFGSSSITRGADGRNRPTFRASKAPPPALCSCRLEFVEAKLNGVDGVKGLEGATDVALSPDGAHVYVASARGNAVTVFRRDAKTGKVTFVEAKVDGTEGVSGLAGAIGLAVSPDGKHVYVVGLSANAVAVFAREPGTGKLRFVEVHVNTAGGVSGLRGATAVAVSPDGAHVYAIGQIDNAVVVFSRDPASGRLTFVEADIGRSGISGFENPISVIVSPEGANVYVTSFKSNSVAVFRREGSTGRLTFTGMTKNGADGVSGLNGANGVTMSGGGSRVYIGSATDNAVVVFARDPASGALGFIGKVANGEAGVTGLDHPTRPSLSPDGTCLYVGAYKDNDVAEFTRTARGTLVFVDVTTGAPGGPNRLDAAAYSVVSADARYLYVAAQQSNSLVVFRREPAQAPVRAAPSPRKHHDSRRPTPKQVAKVGTLPILRTAAFLGEDAAARERAAPAVSSVAKQLFPLLFADHPDPQLPYCVLAQLRGRPRPGLRSRAPCPHRCVEHLRGHLARSPPFKIFACWRSTPHGATSAPPETSIRHCASAAEATRTAR